MQATILNSLVLDMRTNRIRLQNDTTKTLFELHLSDPQQKIEFYNSKIFTAQITFNSDKSTAKSAPIIGGILGSMAGIIGVMLGLKLKNKDHVKSYPMIQSRYLGAIVAGSLFGYGVYQFFRSTLDERVKESENKLKKEIFDLSNALAKDKILQGEVVSIQRASLINKNTSVDYTIRLKNPEKIYHETMISFRSQYLDQLKVKSSINAIFLEKDADHQ
jgi:hypothetical protein